MKTHPGPTAARITVPDQNDDQVREIDYVRWLSQMQADMAQSLGGVLLRAARPVQLGTATAGTLQPTTSAGRLVGVSLHETAGTDGYLVRLRDGRGPDDPLVACLSGPAGGTTNSWWAPGGLSFTTGLYVEVVSGTGLSTAVEGVAYLGAAD